MASSQKRLGNPNWVRGVSGNPRGRPALGLALAQAIRDRVDPHELADAMLEIVRDRSGAARDRVAAFVALADRAWPRLPVAVEVTTTASTALPAGWDGLSPGERLVLLEQMRVLDAVDASPDSDADGDVDHRLPEVTNEDSE